MPKFKIRGQVLPAVAEVSTARFDMTWTEGTGAPPIQFVIQVVKGNLQIECTTDHYDPQYHSLYNTRALELTRAVVDPLAFREGIGLTVMLETIVTPDGRVLPILPHNLALQRIATAFGDVFEAQKLIVTEPLLYLALNELIVAITVPGMITLNCGRAVESLRRILVPVDPNRKLGWATLQETLNISRSYREVITNASTEPRHGDRTGISHAFAQDILERAWEIMNRFVEYRKRGSKPLPVSDFPIL